MAKKHSLDIFDTLRNIDMHNMGFYESLEETEQKGFAPSVVLRWMSSANKPYDEWFLSAANVVNQHFFDLWEYPDLQYKLLALCGLGSNARHNWIPNSKKGKGNTGLESLISKYWPEANELEISIILQKFAEEDSFEDFLDGIGLTNDDAKKYRKVFADFKTTL